MRNTTKNRKVLHNILYIVETVYGHSNHQNNYPYIDITYNKESNTKAEYCFILNEITVYINNIKSIKDLTKVIIHEYQHYLQSPSWFKRYYGMGYMYSNHPYEVQAYKEEKNWNKIWKQVL